MPPHLHPRSRSTMSLFAGTLLASLVVVGMPHVFPCPAPRRTFADSEMTITADGQQVPQVTTFFQMEEEAEKLTHIGHECPVPKPKGVLGELLGFHNARGSEHRVSADGTQ
ncbi:hypothetical protein N7451_003829 [Penicillium sp. IBT 35674x]|nr:hypothetical protein N7451_003829 [Penicillium sp. IBT 35674x]